MKTKIQSLTEGNILSGALKFSFPLMASNVLQVLFTMSDIAVVGKFAGDNALGSVGSTTLIVALFTGFLIGVGSGVNALVARYFGAQNSKAVSESVHTSLIVCLIIGIVVAVTGAVSCGGILRILETKTEFFLGAREYLKIYFLGMPALAIYNYGNGVLSAVGNTTKPLIILLISGIINVMLNLLFVIVLGLDVAGVAYASVIAQYISAICIITVLLKNDGSFGIRPESLRITSDKALLLLKLGIPAGCQNAIFGIANLFIQKAVNSFEPIMVEGNSAAANTDALVYDVMAAVYVACTSYIAQNDGAGNRKRILESYYVTLLYSFVFGAAFGVAFVCFGRGFLSLFTNDSDVVEAGLIRLRIMGLSYAVSAFMDNTIAASRGLGKTLVPTVIVILGSCVFRVIWVYTIFAYYHTIQSLYLLYVFSWTITGAAEILYFAKIYKKRKNRDAALQSKLENEK